MEISCNCSFCGKSGSYRLNEKETENLISYKQTGTGFLQDLFPNVPAWIRSGAIDNRSSGFCICPDCSP